MVYPDSQNSGRVLETRSSPPPLNRTSSSQTASNLSEAQSSPTSTSVRNPRKRGYESLEQLVGGGSRRRRRINIDSEMELTTYLSVENGK